MSNKWTRWLMSDETSSKGKYFLVRIVNGILQIIDEATGTPVGTNHVIDITRDDLKALAVAETMIPLQKYRITDFATLYPSGTGWTFGPSEQLIVTAVSTSELDTRAYSEAHPDHIIEYSIDLPAMYSQWVGTYTGDHFGRITYREDTVYNIRCGFDFLNHWSRLYEDAVGSGNFTKITPPDGVTAYEDFPLLDPTAYGNGEYRNISMGNNGSNFIPMVLKLGVQKLQSGDAQDAIVFNCTVTDTIIGDCCSVVVDGGPANNCLNLIALGSCTVHVGGDIDSLFCPAGVTLYATGSFTHCQTMPGFMSSELAPLTRDYTDELIGFPVETIVKDMFFTPGNNFQLTEEHRTKTICCNDGYTVLLPASPLDGETFKFQDTNSGSDFVLDGNGNNVSGMDGALAGTVTLKTQFHPYQTFMVVFSSVRNRWMLSWSDPATPFETAKLTPEGGFATLMQAGEDLYQGEVVYIQQTGGTDGNVIKAPANSDMPVGVVYADALSGAPVWIVTSGQADVLPKSTVTAARGYVIFVSNTAGRVDQSATAPVNDHWKECGHFLATGSGAGALTRAVIHFN